MRRTENRVGYITEVLRRNVREMENERIDEGLRGRVLTIHEIFTGPALLRQ